MPERVPVRDGVPGKVVLRLEVHPEFGRSPEYLREAKGGVRGNRTLLSNKLFDAAAILQAHGLGQTTSRQIHGRKIIFPQDFAGVGQGGGKGRVITNSH